MTTGIVMSKLAQRIAGLSPEQRALLLRRLQDKNRAPDGPPSIQARRWDGDPVPLSFVQEWQWLIDQRTPYNPAHNINLVARITGPLDVLALEKSLNEIVRRHQVLRASFPVVAGKPVQVIAPDLHLTLDRIDLTSLSGAEREVAATRRATKAIQHPFDLAHGPIIYAALLQLAVEDHILAIAVHHIAFDGWSIGILLNELGILYQAFSRQQSSPLPDLPIQYGDYAVWQREWLTGQVREEQEGYWKRQLDGLQRTELPADQTQPAGPPYQGAVHSFGLSSELVAALQVLCQQVDVTLYMIFVATLDVLLVWRLHQTDVAIGTDFANRSQAETENLIGWFTNLVVLRVDLGGEPTFRELLQRVRTVCLEAYAHQAFPFKLVEELMPIKPLFHVLFVLHNTPTPVIQLEGLQLAPVDVDAEASRFDLTFNVQETATGLRCMLKYKTAVFNPETIIQLARDYELILREVSRQPDVSWNALTAMLT